MILLPLVAFALQGGMVLPAAATFSSAALAYSVDPEQSEDEGDKLISDYYDQLASGDFKGALKSAGKLDLDKDNNQGQALIAVLRGCAMLGLKREADARKLLSEADRLAADSSAIDHVAFSTVMVVERYDLAADYFDRLLAKSPKTVLEFDDQTLWQFLRNEPKDQQTRKDDRRVALARMGYGGHDGDGFAAEAVEILVKRGDIAGANALLPYIDDPQTVENLLIMKKLSALWPRLAAIAGPGLEKVRTSSVAAAEFDYLAKPEDNRKLASLISALRAAGRYDDAIALRSKLPTTAEAVSKIDEDMGWAMNNAALAMNEVGRADDADKLLALLNDASMEDGSWRVSMKINRLELLVSDGRYDKALPLLDLTEESAKTEGNAYAQQLVRRLRYCTMSGLGRKDEAKKLLPDLLAHADDAPGPTVDGLVCGGAFDEAEKIALKSLAKPEYETGFVRSLQAKPLSSSDPSVWDKSWAELRRRPAIVKEFDRLGRDMPDDLIAPPPVAALAK